MKDNTNPANNFMAQHGAPGYTMDENLMVEYQDGDIKVYWASVWGSNFVKTPKGFFTKQPTYRDFCVEVGKRAPARRSPEKFDEYINKALDVATLRETLPGMEEGAVVRNAIFYTLWQYRHPWKAGGSDNKERYCDYDNGERRKRSVEKGDPAFIETRPEGPGYPEMFIRINALIEAMTFLQGQGLFERRIPREEVIDELRKMSRPPYAATGVSPRRLRSTYPIPYSLFLDWRIEGTKMDEEEGA
ncbi:MAG: hypothetical protein C5B54_04155 [Acidobacteria bacterium]|nr:MAG: hypothetical protein C5B54_04155 [Acidobacteriota bacterium]